MGFTVSKKGHSCPYEGGSSKRPYGGSSKRPFVVPDDEDSSSSEEDVPLVKRQKRETCSARELLERALELSKQEERQRDTESNLRDVMEMKHAAEMKKIQDEHFADTEKSKAEKLFYEEQEEKRNVEMEKLKEEIALLQQQPSSSYRPTSPSYRPTSPSYRPTSPIPYPPVDNFSIYSSLRDKVCVAYKTKITSLSNSSTSSTSPGVWGVTLDTGSMHPLPDDAQVAVKDALEEWKTTPDKVIDDAYSQVLHGQTVNYKLKYNMSTTGGIPIQINSETGKERELSLFSPSSTKDISVEMNSFTVPLRTADGNFFFQEEYDSMKNLPYEEDVLVGDGQYVLPFGETFSKPFQGLTFDPSSSESWFRQTLIRKFLCDSKQAWEDDPNSSCFLWGHGTRYHVGIRDDPNGMNMRKTQSAAHGDGVYVAANDYVPSVWDYISNGGSSVYKKSFVIGIAITHNKDPLIHRYRMASHIRIAPEPPNWAQDGVHHAILMKNSQLSSAVPLGRVSE